MSLVCMTAKQVSFHEALGIAVDLARQSDLHRRWKISSIERLFISAIERDHFLVFTRDGQRIGFLTFAYLDQSVEDKLLLGSAKLLAEDWITGDTPWVIDLIAPKGDVLQIVRFLKSEFWPDKVVRSIRRNLDGSIRKVNRWKGDRVRLPVKPDLIHSGMYAS